MLKNNNINIVIATNVLQEAMVGQRERKRERYCGSVICNVNPSVTDCELSTRVIYCLFLSHTHTHNAYIDREIKLNPEFEFTLSLFHGLRVVQCDYI